jgi:hypothetical protein
MPDMEFDQRLTVLEGRGASDRLHKKWSDVTDRLMQGKQGFWRAVGRDGRPIRGAKWRLISNKHDLRLLETLADHNIPLTWAGWDSIQGRRVAAFDFRVDRERSTWAISEEGVDATILPYAGTVDVSPDTGVIWRIEARLAEIPARFKTEWQTHKEDYEEVKVGSERYVLPVGQVNEGNQNGRKTRVECVWERFRKFTADSSVTYQ